MSVKCCDQGSTRPPPCMAHKQLMAHVTMLGNGVMDLMQWQVLVHAKCNMSGLGHCYIQVTNLMQGADYDTWREKIIMITTCRLYVSKFFHFVIEICVRAPAANKHLCPNFCRHKSLNFDALDTCQLEQNPIQNPKYTSW